MSQEIVMWLIDALNRATVINCRGVSFDIFILARNRGAIITISTKNNDAVITFVDFQNILRSLDVPISGVPQCKQKQFYCNFIKNIKTI
jgi:hypothetical protein